MISICSICKNEENRLYQWFETAKEADVISVVDTGSTDRTLEILEELAAKHPDFRISRFSGDFRFDAARKLAASVVPPHSLAMWIDIDETFDAGWADELRQHPEAQVVRTTMQYGNLSYYQVKGALAALHSEYWQNRVHEILNVPAAFTVYESKFKTTHDREAGKEYRNSYLPLLEADWKELKTERALFYYIRELTYQTEEAKLIFSLLDEFFYFGIGSDYCVFSYIHVVPYLAKRNLPKWHTLALELANMRDNSIEISYEVANAARIAGSHFLALHFATKAISISDNCNLMFEYAESAIRQSQEIIVNSCVDLGITDKAVYYGHLFGVSIEHSLVESLKPSETESPHSEISEG